MFGAVASRGMTVASGIGRRVVEGEKPIDPVVIERVEVLDNPWEDMKAVEGVERDIGLGGKGVGNGGKRVKRVRLTFDSSDEEEDSADDEGGMDAERLLGKVTNGMKKGSAISISGVVSSHDVLDDPSLLPKQASILREGRSTTKPTYIGARMPSQANSKEKTPVTEEVSNEEDSTKEETVRSSTKRTTGEREEKDSGQEAEENEPVQKKPNVYASRQRKGRKAREADTLQLLQAFRSRVKNKSTKQTVVKTLEPLVFEKTAEDVRNADDYVMIDPLEQVRKKRGLQQSKEKSFTDNR